MRLPNPTERFSLALGASLVKISVKIPWNGYFPFLMDCFFASDCGHPVKDEHDTIKTLEELEDEISEALLGRRETINSVGWLGVRLGDTDLRTQMCRCRMCY